MPSTWYIARDGKTHGPITEAEFAEFLRRGYLQPSDYIWYDELDDWVLGEKLLPGQHHAAEPPVHQRSSRRSLADTVAACRRFLPPWLRRVPTRWTS